MRQIVASQKHGRAERRPDGSDRHGIAQHKTHLRPRRQLRNAPIRHTLGLSDNAAFATATKHLDSATLCRVRFFLLLPCCQCYCVCDGHCAKGNSVRVSTVSLYCWTASTLGSTPCSQLSPSC